MVKGNRHVRWYLSERPLGRSLEAVLRMPRFGAHPIGDAFWEFQSMTQNIRKSWYWAGGASAAIIALLIVLWLAGVFDGSAAVG